jgi:hypothetical protein
MERICEADLWGLMQEAILLRFYEWSYDADAATRSNNPYEGEQIFTIWFLSQCLYATFTYCLTQVQFCFIQINLH